MEQIIKMKRQNIRFFIILLRNLSLMLVISLLVVERLPYFSEQVRPYLALSLVAFNSALIFQIFEMIFFNEKKNETN